MFGAKQKSEWYRHMIQCTRQRAYILKLSLEDRLDNFPLIDNFNIFESQQVTIITQEVIIPTRTETLTESQTCQMTKRKDTQSFVHFKRLRCGTC